ncbi:hypothetical protein BH09BAC2_BH09BAC2_12070 [soil metagenome]
MKKFLVLLVLILSVKGYCQETLEKQLNDLLGDISVQDTSKSTFKISLGLGNRRFSINNNTLNADQSENKIVINPTVGYFHKSGFSISASAFAFTDNSNFKFYQFALTPAYEYTTGKNLAAAISYTRFFQADAYTQSASPVQNDLYGKIYFKKPWMQPGVSLGYGSGKYKQITQVDTVVRINNQLVHYRFKDTASVKMTWFNISPSIQHEFEFEKVFSKNDGFMFNPELLVNIGSGTYDEKHSGSGLASLVNGNGRRGKRISDKSSASEVTPLQLESLAINIDMEYGIGNFAISPNIYLDYYLPATTSNRFSGIYQLNFIYRF